MLAGIASGTEEIFPDARSCSVHAELFKDSASFDVDMQRTWDAYIGRR